MLACSPALNVPLRSEIGAKCQILPKRYKGWHSFEVRGVFFHEDTVESWTRGEDPVMDRSVDAYGVYGANPKEDNLQMHISDCPTLEDALSLKQALEKFNART